MHDQQKHKVQLLLIISNNIPCVNLPDTQLTACQLIFTTNFWETRSYDLKYSRISCHKPLSLPCQENIEPGL